MIQISGTMELPHYLLIYFYSDLTGAFLLGFWDWLFGNKKNGEDLQIILKEIEVMILSRPSNIITRLCRC
jgi:hypothetical protein